MIDSIQINKIIAAHGQWKLRLQKAIATGTSEFNVATASQDNQCDFGKWLYSLTPEEQQKELWKQVREMHAKFHQEAARILSLALSGRKTEAFEALNSDQLYTQTSGKLVILLAKMAAEG